MARVIFRFSVIDPATGREHDLEVTAEPDTPVASVLHAIPFDTRGRICFAGDQPLNPGHTVAESPLIMGAWVTIGQPGPVTRPHSRSTPGGAAGVLRVIAGPDTGRTYPLFEGVHGLGRAPSCHIHLSDPMVSREHAVIRVAHSTVTIENTESGDSANGTLLGGARISGPAPMRRGEHFQIGSDVLQFIPQTQMLHATRAPDGRLEFDRAYSPAPAIHRVAVQLPAAPGAGNGFKALLASLAAPILLGGVMALALHQWQMMLFAAFAPLSAGTSYVTDRRARRARTAAFDTAKAAAVQQISTAMAGEEQLRRDRSPGPSGVLMVATGAERGLWPRDRDTPDALVLRVGTADRVPAVDLQGDRWKGFEQPMLRSVPVTVDLRRTGVLGVVGLPEYTRPFTDWLVAQLATFRSPDDLRLVVLTPDDGPGLIWTRWLPHLDGGSSTDAPCLIGNTATTRAQRIDELKDLITRRLDAVKDHQNASFDEDVVVVMQGALGLRHLPGMRELLRDGPRVGVYCICVDQRDMNECRGVLEFGADGSGRQGWQLTVRRQRDEMPETAVPEALRGADAERLARALAPMRDRLTRRGDPSSIPYPVRFLDLLQIDRPSADDVLISWKRQPGPTLNVPLGLDTQGIVTVDLAGQGPHTMLAGATGAGKSILLQTLVTSLLLANRPDELNLVLVDFKGGSAFLPFEHCPHVVSLIRNTEDDPAERFDEAAAQRVLASVRAEVRRRESILGRYGGEIDHYWRERARNSQLPPLPRLVMVFDEYARAMDTSPDFPKELVAVAGKGRSLGMHLVFATQSLQGKLSAEMKNNISLRITLRQNETSDSVEVLGVPDAVTIPGRLRGRGLIVCTLDENRQPRPFQSGYLGSPPPSGQAAPAQIRITAWPVLGLPRPVHEAPAITADTDQTLTIAAVEAAAARLGLAPSKRPLLPPLPSSLMLADLPHRATIPGPPEGLAFALPTIPRARSSPASPSTWPALIG